MIPQFVAETEDKTLRQEIRFETEASNPLLSIHESVTVRVSLAALPSDGVPLADMDVETTAVSLESQLGLAIQLNVLKRIADMVNENLPRCRAVAELVKNHVYFAVYEWSNFHTWFMCRAESPDGVVSPNTRVFEDAASEGAFRHFLSQAVETLRNWNVKTDKRAVVIKF